MTRQYYSSRNNPTSITLSDLYWKLQNLFELFKEKDYLKSKAGITSSNIPAEIMYEASIALNFQPFPITKWELGTYTEDQIFDTIEFLYDYVSKPGKWANMTDDSGWNYSDYENYDEAAGREEFRRKANQILSEYKTGFELTKDGLILSKATGSLKYILDADIIPYDEINVDSKVQHAIKKWRNRHLSPVEQKEAIREMADVFEWLKKTKDLSNVFDSKDESAIFDIANNFAIRHHNPKQKTQYDSTIWFSWIFHFYLATYHAAIRLLQKKEASEVHK
jgi:hypothetical protein